MKMQSRKPAVLPRTTILLALSVFLTGWGNRALEWPYSGPMPDEPVATPPARYESIVTGAKSYRPVEPMPWGDINRRVAPPAAKESGPSGGPSPPAPSPDPHKGH